jgi:hypothetical protein
MFTESLPPPFTLHHSTLHSPGLRKGLVVIYIAAAKLQSRRGNELSQAIVETSLPPSSPRTVERLDWDAVSVDAAPRLQRLQRRKLLAIFKPPSAKSQLNIV